MTILLNSNVRKLLVSAVALLVIVSFTSCGKNIAFQNSTIVPAAQGKVSVKKDNNKNNT